MNELLLSSVPWIILTTLSLWSKGHFIFRNAKELATAQNVSHFLLPWNTLLLSLCPPLFMRMRKPLNCSYWLRLWPSKNRECHVDWRLALLKSPQWLYCNWVNQNLANSYPRRVIQIPYPLPGCWPDLLVFVQLAHPETHWKWEEGPGES